MMLVRILLCAFATTFITWGSGSKAQSIDLMVSTICSDLLAPRWKSNLNMISQTVVGHGTAHVITPKEYSTGLGFIPKVQARLQLYANSPSLRHRAGFVLLPDTAYPIGHTLASTYADNPSKYLAFSNNSQWLAANLPQLSDQLPQHLVVMSHHSDPFIAVHEVVHLEDFDGIYDYAAKANTSYIIRMDVFTILTELHAYQEQFRMIRSESPQTALAAAERLARDLRAQIGPSFMAIDEKARLELQKISGLSGFDLAQFQEYLTSGPAFPTWPEILTELNSESFREHIP